MPIGARRRGGRHDRARHRPAPPRPGRLRSGAGAAVRDAPNGRPVRVLRPHGAHRSRAGHPALGRRAAASAHRAGDGHLSVRRRDHASRQRRVRAADSPRRGQLDDRRPGHHAFRALRARAPGRRARARHPGLGRAAPGTRGDRAGVRAPRRAGPADLRRRRPAVAADRRRRVRRPRECRDALADVLCALGSRSRRASRARYRIPERAAYVAAGAVEVLGSASKRGRCSSSGPGSRCGSRPRWRPS